MASEKNLKAINLFESNVNSILRDLRNINDRVGTALKYYSNAVEKFKEASITISDNETIKIANIKVIVFFILTYLFSHNMNIFRMYV